MDPFVKEREAITRDLYRHNCWPWYATIDECLANLDKATFLHGITKFTAYTGLEASAPNVEPNTRFFCGIPTVAPFRGGVCKWPATNITYTTIGSLGTISEADFKGCAVLTMGWWSEACGIRPTWTANTKTANVVMHAQRIDGPQGVLAQMQLPCGASMADQMEGQFDLERLVISDSPPAGTLDLARIMCHELGHALGSDHLSGQALLAPTYNPRIRKPTNIDAAEMQKRYGPPVASPVPPIEPTPSPVPGDKLVSFAIGPDGSIKSPIVPGYRCIKVA